MKSVSTLLLALAGCFAACGMTYEFAKDGSGPYGVWSKSMEKQPVSAAVEEKAGVNGSAALVIADAGKKSFKIAVNDLYQILADALHKPCEFLFAGADIRHYLRIFHRIRRCGRTGIEQNISLY